jgi:hypothetical protein
VWQRAGWQDYAELLFRLERGAATGSIVTKSALAAAFAATGAAA